MGQNRYAALTTEFPKDAKRLFANGEEGAERLFANAEEDAKARLASYLRLAQG